jgi:ankyrin repeat protein
VGKGLGIEAGAAGWTPLHAAVYSGNYNTSKLLLELGAALDTRIASDSALGGFTPLLAAACGWSLEIVKLLAERRATIYATGVDNTTAMHCAANVSSVEMIRYFAALGVSVQSRSSNGAMPIHSAAQSEGSESASAIETLVHLGASLDAQDTEGRTPLFIAAAQGHTEAVRVLLSLGSTFSIGSNLGDTPLSIAIENGHQAIAALLRARKSTRLWRVPP